MTPNHDHATLFVAPLAVPVTEAVEGTRTVDDGAEAMRRLRHPFAVGRSPELPGLRAFVEARPAR